MWFRRARELRAVRQRFAAVADRIGARDGQLVNEMFYGGTLVPYGLTFITFRPGPADEVAQAQIDAAVVAGYSDPLPPWISHSTVFVTQGDLPQLAIETFPAGSTIRGTDIVIPPGCTGVIVTLS